MKTNLIHISFVMPGDTIIHNGEIKTVCKNNIKDGGFCGRTIFGDSYKMGTQQVILVTKINE